MLFSAYTEFLCGAVSRIVQCRPWLWFLELAVPKAAVLSISVHSRTVRKGRSWESRTAGQKLRVSVFEALVPFAGGSQNLRDAQVAESSGVGLGR